MEDFIKEMGFEQSMIYWEVIIYKDTELEISTVPMEKEACTCCEIMVLWKKVWGNYGRSPKVTERRSNFT